MPKSTFVYVTYIRTTPEKLWKALTTREFQEQYWFGMHCETTWKAGSPWKLVNPEGKVYDAGEIVECDPPRRVVIRWQNEWNPELKADGPSTCTMELEPASSAVKLTITHSNDKEASKMIGAVSGGWPKVLSNLKSLLENGTVALDEAYPPKKAEAAKV